MNRLVENSSGLLWGFDHQFLFKIRAPRIVSIGVIWDHPDTPYQYIMHFPHLFVSIKWIIHSTFVTLAYWDVSFAIECAPVLHDKRRRLGSHRVISWEIEAPGGLLLLKAYECSRQNDKKIINTEKLYKIRIHFNVIKQLSKRLQWGFKQLFNIEIRVIQTLSPFTS